MRGLQRVGNVFGLNKIGVNKASSKINRRYLNNHVKRVLQAQEPNAALLRQFNSNQISQSRTFGNLIKFLQESGKNPQNSFAGNSNVMYAVVPINNLPKIYLVPLETDAPLNGQPIVPVVMSNGSLSFHYVVFDPKSQSDIDNNQSNTKEAGTELLGFSDTKAVHDDKSVNKDSLTEEKVTTNLGHLTNNLAILGKPNESEQMDSKFSSLAQNDGSSQISANITDFHIKLKLRIPKGQLSNINNSVEKPKIDNGNRNQNASLEVEKKIDSGKLCYVTSDVSSQVDTIQASVDTVPLGFKVMFSSPGGILNSNELANIGNCINFGGAINKLLGSKSVNLNQCAFYSKKSKSKRGNQWDARIKRLCEGDKTEIEAEESKEEKKCLDDYLNEPFSLDLMPYKPLPFSCDPKEEKKIKAEKKATQEFRKVDCASLAEEALSKQNTTQKKPEAIKVEISPSDCNNPRLCPEREDKHVLRNCQDIRPK